ncbi:MAG TPA: redox-regulated ATPase YchF [Deltaproteobacteria bacterium]|nr:redox-regulated ATPase YchF [Deltaproteobacteria bacterium]
MGFSCGIVGLPNSGKSTIFNAMTSLCVSAQPYPFCTIEPNVGIVPVPDDRLEQLARLLNPEKLTPTSIEFIDIAGLIKDAHKGEGLGNRFLGHIRNVDAIAHIVRCFQAGSVPHVYSDIDPARDIEIVETELVISDLEIVEEQLKKIERVAKVSKEKHGEEQEVLLKIHSFLEKGEFVDSSEFSEEQKAFLRSFNLITTKPVFYVANVDEAGLNGPLDERLEALTIAKGRKAVAVCGKLEEELASLAEDERASYMDLYEMNELGIEKVIRVGYDVLGLITFYTIVGKEMRAWTIPAGTTAIEAAGKIHTDMQRGFIRAEALSYDDFITCGSEHAAREKGLIHVEGKEYVVRDGDILHIRFNV